MSYESNGSGIGVGKTYGERAAGGIDGQVKTFGKEVQATFEFSAGTVDDVYSVGILNSYIVTGLTLYVSEAFGTGATADLSIDGGSGLTTDLNLNAVGVSKPSLAGLTKLTGAVGVQVVLDLSKAQTQAATAGKASLVVTYERI
jgi:hypothetical protein